jgi:hypothetical protein
VILFTVIYYASLFGPVVLLSFMWRRLLSQPRDMISFSVAALLSLSYPLLMAALVFRSAVLGGDVNSMI